MITRLLWKRLHFSLLILLLFSINGLAQSTPGALITIEKKIDSLVSIGAIPSASLAVAKDGKIIWQKSFGWADIKNKIKASPNTIYALGSLSKSISATGLMTMAEQEKLKLEDKVNKKLGTASLTSYVGNPNQVKVWHLLNMAAGIPHGWSTYENADDIPTTAEEKDQFLKRIGLITFPPGKVFQYSNYSFGVVDLLMERVSKQSLEDYMREQVFLPLAMPNSYTRYNADRSADFAVAYNAELEVIPPYDFLPYGGGGFFSSANDLINYGMFHLKNKVDDQKPILSEKTRDLMHNFDKGPSPFMGLGWFNSGHALVSNGRISGAQSHLQLVPSENLAVVCLINASIRIFYADQIVDEIINLLAPDLEKQMTEEKYMAIFETPYDSNKELLGQWQGEIQASTGPIPAEMNFNSSGQVLIQINEGEEKTLEHVVFTPSGKLSSGLRIKIPVPEFDGTAEVYSLLELQLHQGTLIGHIAPMFSNEKGSFCYGVYVGLKRVKSAK